MTATGVNGAGYGPGPAERKPVAAMALTAAAVVIAAVAAVWFVLSLVEEARERDLRAWQVRLGIIADSRAEAVTTWLDDQRTELLALAGNPGLRLLMSMPEADPPTPQRLAQEEILRNLFSVTAGRAGFDAAPTGPDVPANVGRQGVAGLALVDPDGRLIVGTSAMPAISGEILAFVAGAPRGETAMMGPFPGADGRPALAMLAPVYPVQAEESGENQVGWIIGIRPVDDALFPVLAQPGSTEATLEAVLIGRREASVVYLSPLLDGTPALARTLDASTQDLAAGFALESPGGFAVRRDYRDAEVLLTSRAIAAAPGWSLMVKVDRNEALADTDARSTRLLIILLLGVGLALAGVIGAWFYGTSRRAAQAASLYAAANERLARSDRFLRLVTDTQPAALVIVDADGRIGFANQRLADRAGVAARDLVSKPLSLAIGTDAAKRYLRKAETVRDTGTSRVLTHREDGDGADARVSRATLVPLADESEVTGGVLVVEEDITETIAARERRERVLNQIVDSLVTIVDQRDPYSGDHSRQVGKLARRVAEEMALDTTAVDTVSTAGLLMNVGKILVPKEVLTRSGSLSDGEIEQVRASILASADLVAGIEFDGPVTDTLRQVFERTDGAGQPGGLAGTDILVEARILAVCNAFVAMVSPRAHRQRMAVDAALDALHDGVGKAFDRSVVAALINYLDNKGGRRAFEALEAS